MIPSVEEGRGDYVFFLHNAGSGFLCGWPFCGSIGVVEFVDLFSVEMQIIYVQ